MNTVKKNGGFTLVELIIVIAILAILSSVAVAGYSAYINKANESADTTALNAVKTAAMAALATEGAVTEIEVTAANGTISVITVTYGEDDTELVIWGTGATATNEFVKAFAEYFEGNTMPTLKALKTGATWTNNGWDAE